MNTPHIELNRTAVMTVPGTIEVQQLEVARPSGRQALVRIEAVGICGSDTAYYTVGRIGDYVVDGPLVLGHEVAGQVVAVGEDVQTIAVGARVAIEPGTPCRDCQACHRGSYHLCSRLEFLATPPYDGALAEFLLIDERNLFVMPDSMSYEEGALIEPLSVGIWAARRAQLAPGDEVLVTGGGPVGLLAASVALAFGAASATVVDVNPARVDRARSRGCHGATLLDDVGDRFDVLLECSGADGVLDEAMHHLGLGGRAAAVGIAKKAQELSLDTLMPKELSIVMVNRYAHTWPTGIALVGSGRVEVASLVTHRYSLEQTEQALLAGRTHSDAIKAVVQPQLVEEDDR
ncbi:MAG: NAD(P)-dependent alcohol dehydrogenase [Beutenbergiaceae bacterium]